MVQYKKILLTFIFTCFSINIFAATSQLHKTLGGAALNAIKNAQFVTILPLIRSSQVVEYGPEPEIHLSCNEIERIKRQLLDDHNYAFNKVKSCQFIPEISLKFRGDNGDEVYLFVSPICNQMLVSMEKTSVLLNYDPSHERLESYFQQLIAEARKKNAPYSQR